MVYTAACNHLAHEQGVIHYGTAPLIVLSADRAEGRRSSGRRSVAAKRESGGWWGSSGGCSGVRLGPRDEAVAAGSSEADSRADRPMRDVSRHMVTRLARMDCTHDKHMQQVGTWFITGYEEET